MGKTDNFKNSRLNNLKTIREQRKITQVKLSVDMEVSQELISQYECGSSLPTITNLVKLADYFNCSTDYLLGRTDIVAPIKTINKEDSEISSLVTNYNLLPKDKKKQLDCFLDFLTQYENGI